MHMKGSFTYEMVKAMPADERAYWVEHISDRIRRENKQIEEANKKR